MNDPSRLRPRGKGVRPVARAENTGGILGAAQVTAKKIHTFYKVKPRNNPLDAEQLRREELQARMTYGRLKRNRQGGLALLGAWIGWAMARLNQSRAMRSLNLFFFHYGTVMAAGAAYMMFFSVAALLWAGFSVAGIIIGGNPDYQNLIVNTVQNALPGVIGENGLINESQARQLFDIDGFNLSFGIAVVLAVVTSLSWVHGLRSGIRSIWERPLMAENVIFVKLKDFGLLIVLAIVALTSAIIGFLSQGLIRESFSLLGWDSAANVGLLIQAASFLISFGLDMMVAVLLMRVASRLMMPVSALWQSALLAGVGTSVLRLLSGQLLQNFTNSPNPLLNTFGTVLGVFFYFFIFGLVYLVAASWGAVTASDYAQKHRTQQWGPAH
ncbi:hypothetical protein GCM10023354_15960 [Garicola koreensis]|uniref:YihY/virulence factor BrkB family protein n=1 Tax=Garicola koreensis TaxID=1262554 RepID=UPI0031EF96D8